MKTPCLFSTRFARSLLAPLCLLLSLGTVAEAQQWRFTLSPYLLFPYMSGHSGIGDLVVDVEANPGDIFSRLQFGAMLMAEANNGTWGFALDGIYMDLEQDDISVGPASATARMTQGAVELAAFRRVTPWAELLAGGRFNLLTAELETQGVPARSREHDESWFDPIVGARLRASNTGKWVLEFRGDVGGFGIGSDLAWQVHPRVGYHLSGTVELGLGYRVISMDYVGTTSDFAPFVYDMRTFGPEIGLVFHF